MKKTSSRKLNKKEITLKWSANIFHRQALNEKRANKSNREKMNDIHREKWNIFQCAMSNWNSSECMARETLAHRRQRSQWVDFDKRSLIAVRQSALDGLNIFCSSSWLCRAVKCGKRCWGEEERKTKRKIENRSTTFTSLVTFFNIVICYIDCYRCRHRCRVCTCECSACVLMRVGVLRLKCTCTYTYHYIVIDMYDWMTCGANEQGLFVYERAWDKRCKSTWFCCCRIANKRSFCNAKNLK